MNRRVSATPLDFADGDTVYLRFHGPGGKYYKGSYSDNVLQEYTTYIHKWKEEGKTVYVYLIILWVVRCKT